MSELMISEMALSELLQAGDGQAVASFIDSLSPTETARAISRLTEPERIQLFNLLTPEDAAEVFEEISDAQAADLAEEMKSDQAAAIIEEMTSDHQADLLGEMNESSSQAILSKMHRKEAKEARALLNYDPESAGGLMISEFLAFKKDDTVQDVLNDLKVNQGKYTHYSVQYFYVVDPERRLVGVLRINDILFPARTMRLEDLMIKSPHSVAVDAPLPILREFFEAHHLFGAPIVDEKQRLVGVVLKTAVEEALSKQKTRTFLRLSGIVGGEEFRTMPLFNRSGRRLSWLSLNIILNIFAASIIAIYQDTLAAVITLAVFLPMVSDMSGCSGNQAVAVSMRELSLGLVRPKELAWVFWKEIKVGLINGLTLGMLLGSVAVLWKGNPWLGLVIGGALAANTIVSVTLGGMLPLILKRLKLDPALVSSPLLTTVTDMCGFFFVLSFATYLMPQLTGA